MLSRGWEWLTIAVGAVAVAVSSVVSADQGRSPRLDEVILQLAGQGGISLMFLGDLGRHEVPDDLPRAAKPDEARTLLRDLLQEHGLRLIDGPAHTMVVVPVGRGAPAPSLFPARALAISRCGEHGGREFHLRFRNINLEDFIVTVRSLVNLPLNAAFGSGPTLTLAGNRAYAPTEVCQLLGAALSFAELLVVEHGDVFEVVRQ